MQIWKSPFLKTRVFSTDSLKDKHSFLLVAISLLVLLFAASLLEGRTEPLAKISHDSGVYTEPFELSIAYGLASGEIRYTLDGEDPSIESNLYLQNIVIPGDTVLKVALFKDDERISSIQSRSYVFTEHDLPIVSLITEPEDLWDSEEGIYVDSNYDQRGDDWEKEAHMSVINESESIGLETEVEFRIFGETTRKYDQKSFKLCADDDSGSEYMRYDFFNNGELYHECVLLRNSGNDWRGTMFRDSLAHKIIEGTGLDTIKSTPAVVYLNGEYWGIYNVREIYDDDYLLRKYGASDESITLIEQSLEAKSYPRLREGPKGSESKYIELFNNLDNLDYLKENIDTQNFADFFLSNIYLANSDFTLTNIRAWRFNTNEFSSSDNKPLDGKWRWLPYDLDYTMGLYQGNGFKYLLLNIDSDQEENGRLLIENIMRSLLKEEEYKNYFINRFADLINTTFESGSNINEFKDLKEKYRSEIPRHTQKWGSASGVDSYSEWLANTNEIENYFSIHAQDTKDLFIKDFGLSGSSKIHVTPNPKSGGYVKINTVNTKDDIRIESLEYFNDVPILVEAVPYFGYKFVGWTEPDLGNEKEFELVLTDDIELKPVFEPYLKLPL